MEFDDYKSSKQLILIKYIKFNNNLNNINILQEIDDIKSLFYSILIIN